MKQFYREAILKVNSKVAATATVLFGLPPTPPFLAVFYYSASLNSADTTERSCRGNHPFVCFSLTHMN